MPRYRSGSYTGPDLHGAYEFGEGEVFRRYSEAARPRPMLHLIQLGLPRKIEAFRNNDHLLRITIPGGEMMKEGHRTAMQTKQHTWLRFTIVDLKHDEKKAETVITMEINR